LGFGRSAAFGRTPRERGARPRGGPRSALPAPRGRCARICLPRSLRDQGAPLPIDEGGIAQERPLAPRRCVRFVVATTRSATPRSLAARREENALRDPAWKPVKRSHVPCGRSPAARSAGRRGGHGAARRLAAAPAEDAGGTVLGGLPSAALGPSLLRPVPRRPRRDGRAPPSASLPPRRGTVPGERALQRQIRGLRPHPEVPGYSGGRLGLPPQPSRSSGGR